MEQVRKKSKINFPIIPAILFAATLIATIALYVFNMFLTTNIDEQSTELQKIEASIKDLKKDKNLQVYTLVESNKTILDQMTKRSKVTDYINHLAKINNTYGVSFTGFSLANGKITTQASSKNKTAKILAYINVKNFIKKYRQDETALFDLEFINSFEGNSTIKFPVSFTIK